LEIIETTDTTRSISYLDIHIDSIAGLRTTLYDKRYFNFPWTYISSNTCIWSIVQLIRYSSDYGSYHDFLNRRLILASKLLNQGFPVVKLKSSIRLFYGRHLDLFNRCVTNGHWIWSVWFNHNPAYLWLIIGFVTRVICWVPLVEQALFIFCQSLFVFLSYFF